MNRCARYWVALGTLGCLAAAALPSQADLGESISTIFGGAVGAAGGDVNADGRANAADISGLLLGLQNPTQLGPYGSGWQRLTFTKKSETMPDKDRVLVTDVWYPAAAGTWKNDNRPGGQLKVPLASGLHNLPLVLFSHGSCGFSEQSIFLMRRLASWGFIVAAPPHPGNTTSEYVICETPEQLQDSFVNRPADIVFVTDQLLALNEDPASFFYGAIDPTRVGMSGHSYGGLTTLRVLARDARFVAGLALAPVVDGIESETASITQPLMIQVGTLDDLLGNGRKGYDLTMGVRYRVEIDRMGHTPFSDFCLECGPDSISLSDAHVFILRYALPFLLHHVAGDARFDAFLEPDSTPAGVAYFRDLRS
ncbi:MAG: prolyl oligopeptidase family serine peptidase [Deltaproteobacteria bacterium]|nr:prolyl oligopeptidase family serine peptidase [Deltaproteobacteria bacterium]